ncbi:MAG: hypothetical protein Q4D57_01000, partial [Clostridia bacterium]|nr:hypothetical protein [Clostridia bacterium]
MILYPEFKSNLKKSIGLAAPSTKELILSSVNSDSQKFPELLAKYYWGGTRDYNVALIIIAFYAYCINNNSDTILKAFANMIKQNGTNHHKLLENLKKGDGTGIRNCIGKNFDDTLDYVLRKALPCDANNKEIDAKNEKIRNKVIENFKNHAKKITAWKTNKTNVENLIDKLLRVAPDESESQSTPTDIFGQHLKDDLSKYASSSDSQKPEKAAETLVNFLIFCIDNQKNIDIKMKNLTSKSNINTKNIISGLNSENGEQIKNGCGIVFKNALSSALQHLDITNVNTTKLIENFINALGKIDDKITLPEPLTRKIKNLAYYYGIDLVGDTKPTADIKQATGGGANVQDSQIEPLVSDICKILTNPNQNKQTNEAIFPKMEKLVQILKDKKKEIKNKYIQKIKIATK